MNPYNPVKGSLSYLAAVLFKCLCRGREPVSWRHLYGENLTAAPRPKGRKRDIENKKILFFRKKKC